MESYILVLACSYSGATASLAEAIHDGVEEAGCNARLRIPEPLPNLTSALDAPVCQNADLRNCAGLALGSPTRFGNMEASMRAFWDNTGDIWASGALNGKPATVFTSTGSQHGGQETTLLSMMLTLYHHGMMILGLPSANGAIANTSSGGTPYGATAVMRGKSQPDATELEIARTSGIQLANLVRKLESSNG